MLHSLWILAATFFTVLTYVFVKWVPPQYEIWDIFFVRSDGGGGEDAAQNKDPEGAYRPSDMRHARFADQHRDRTASADRHG